MSETEQHIEKLRKLFETAKERHCIMQDDFKEKIAESRGVLKGMEDIIKDLELFEARKPKLAMPETEMIAKK